MHISYIMILEQVLVDIPAILGISSVFHVPLACGIQNKYPQIISAHPYFSKNMISLLSSDYEYLYSFSLMKQRFEKENLKK